MGGGGHFPVIPQTRCVYCPQHQFVDGLFIQSQFSFFKRLELHLHVSTKLQAPTGGSPKAQGPPAGDQGSIMSSFKPSAWTQGSSDPCVGGCGGVNP